MSRFPFGGKWGTTVTTHLELVYLTRVCVTCTRGWLSATLARRSQAAAREAPGWQRGGGRWAEGARARDCGGRAAGGGRDAAEIIAVSWEPDGGKNQLDATVLNVLTRLSKDKAKSQGAQGTLNLRAVVKLKMAAVAVAETKEWR